METKQYSKKSKNRRPQFAQDEEEPDSFDREDTKVVTKTVVTTKRSTSRKKKGDATDVKTEKKIQIVYESEDAYAAEAFRKYMLFQSLEAKAGTQIKNYVEQSEYYMQNFKAHRDSEFSEYDDIDLTKLRTQRNVDIDIVKDRKKNIDVYRRDLNKRGTKKTLIKYEGVGDIEVDQEIDEDKLIELYVKKQEQKAKLAEQLRDRQSRLMHLNDEIRKYDLRIMKTSEMDRLRGELGNLKLNWSTIRMSLDDKLKFIEKIHRKHHEEVNDYNKFSDNIDKSKFVGRMKKLTFELVTDEKTLHVSLDDLIRTRDQLKIFIERVKRDVAEEEKNYQYLKQKLIELDGSMDNANKELRVQIDKMKAEMIRINNYSIDIARNPAAAIERISNPILELLNTKIDEYILTLTVNLSNKRQNYLDVQELKNKIFEEKTVQINLRRIREEIVYQFLDLKEDICIIQSQLAENIKRKTKLAEKVQLTTDEFKNEEMDLRVELDRVKKKLLHVFAHREKVEDQSTYLVEDRGNIGAPRKYLKSITDFLRLAHELETASQEIPRKILTLEMLLKIDDMYLDKRGKARPVHLFYKCGRYAEKDKNEVMIVDIRKTQEYILEILKNKENLEEQLAAFGSIHHIYVRNNVFNIGLQKTFQDTQDDIKMDIKKYLREKNQMMRYLEALGQDFEQNRTTIGLQEGELRKQQARYKAQNQTFQLTNFRIFFLLQEKILKIRILEDELSKIQRIALAATARPDDRPESEREDVNAYERELVFKLEQEQKQKDQEIASLKELMQKKDTEIDKYEQIVEDRGHELIQEEVLIEEKAKAILERQGYNGRFDKIAKQTYKIGELCYVYLKMKKEPLENVLLVKSNIKGEKVKRLREFKIEGDVLFEFESFVKAVVVK